MLLIRLMYVLVYYISHILYTRTAYIYNVLVINTELYWLTVMESGQIAGMCRACLSLSPLMLNMRYRYRVAYRYRYIHQHRQLQIHLAACLPSCGCNSKFLFIAYFVDLFSPPALRLRLLPISRIRHVCPARSWHSPHGI